MLTSTTTSTTVSRTTGQTCTTEGPYKSDRLARVTVVVLNGQQFPPDTDGKSTTWRMTVESQTLTYTTA